MRKRPGSVRDLLTVATALIFIVVGWIAGTLVLTEVTSAGTALNTGVSGQVLSQAQSALHIMDYGIVMVIGSIYLAALVFALRIPSRPIYIIPSTLFVILSGFISAEFSNVLWKFVNAGPKVTSAANQYPIMLEVVKQFPLIQVGVGFLIIIALYTKRPQQGRRLTA